MTGFLGEYEIAVDAKGRFLLPSGFRKQLPEGAADKFIISRGFEGCLTIYPIAAWQKVYDKISGLDDFNAEDRKFRRLFLNGATSVELDSADRLLIPKQLQEHAGIKKDAVILAAGEKLELWDKDTYYKYMDDNKDDLSALGQKISMRNKAEKEQ